MTPTDIELDTSQVVKGLLDMVVLAALDASDGYGYDVVRRIRGSGLIDVSDASVYGTLRRLFRSGQLSSYVVPSDEGPHRKYYGLTPLGHKAFDAQRDQWTLFSATIDAICEGGAFSRSPDPVDFDTQGDGPPSIAQPLPTGA
jgi:PadR family transcriptional regulator, regulatory protein PadR